ncbi:uncharacterized protein LOC110414800 [Herrania umbratica]|uniref:Uncharacterized protein LOC110414800 n=1 Tax=Herrania umbratica TaxID=108875 RepID=A0A6J1A5A0_9ROSI|nr:uncharacterized protein LOC110414800 [Herrania umbratica]
MWQCRYWSYNCFACNFAAHALCAAKEMRPATCHGENVSSSGTTAAQSDEIHHKEDAASGTTQDQPEPAKIQDPTLQAMGRKSGRNKGSAAFTVFMYRIEQIIKHTHRYWSPKICRGCSQVRVVLTK